MIEEQVNVIILPIDDNPLLTRDKCKPGFELQQEPFQLPEDRCLEVPFAVGIGKPEEIKQIRIAKNQTGVTRPSSRSTASS